MATVKPIAIVSPMKKARKAKKKSNKIGPKKSSKNSVYPSPYSDNVSLTDSAESLLHTAKRNINYEKQQNRLCSLFEKFNIATPTVSSDVQCFETKIPEHDRKILQRMSAKMKREIANIEISHRAHLLWETEREQREKLQQEHNVEYNRYLKCKRQAEKELNEKKFEETALIYDWEKEHLRTRLSMKETAAAKRLRALEYVKHNEISRKQELAQERSESALVALRERKLEEVGWRRALAEDLQRKSSAAEANREVLIRINRQRTAIDNKIHEEIQRRNWQDQRLQEMEKMSQLREQLTEKNRKIEMIQTARDRFVKESRRLADCTAKMRENIKRSLSPDVFMRSAAQSRHQMYRSTPQMCFTPNSQESHIRLG